MILRLTHLFVLLTVALQSINAFAGVEEFKDVIWKDCEAAKSEVEKFTEQDRQSAVGFLKGIITLNLSTDSINPPLNPEIIKAPDVILGDVSIAQSLDPERTNRAKKCASDLLPILVPESAQTLPELISQSEDLRISSELRAIYAKDAYIVAQALSSPTDTSSRLPDPLLDQLFTAYLSNPTSLKEQILSFYPQQLLERVGSILLASDCVLDCSKEIRLCELLARIDLQNAAMKDSVVKLLEQLRPDIRVISLRSLQYSTPLYENLLRYILNRLENADKLERTQLFQNLNTIFNHELRTASLAIDPSLRLGMIKQFELSSASERDIIEKGLSVIAPLYKGFTSQIAKVAQLQDSDLRTRAARILSKVINQDKETKQLIAKLLKDSSIDVQIAALESSLSGNDASTLLNSALNINKNIDGQLKAKQINDQFALESKMSLMRIVSLVSVAELPEPWSKIAMEAIEIGLTQNVQDFSAAFNILQSNPKQSSNDLRLFARSKDNTKRRAAVYVMRKAVLSNPTAFDILLTLLADSDSEVAKRSQFALLGLNADLKQLLSIRNKLSPSPRLDELLLESGLRPDLELEVQKRVAEIPCVEIAETASVCLPRSVTGAFCASIVAHVPRCIESGVLSALPSGAVEKAIVLQPKIRDFFIQALLNPSISQQAQLEIGLYLLRAKSGNEQVVDKICDLSTVATEETLSEILSFISLDQNSVKNCLDIFKKHFESSDLGIEQKARFLKYIVQLDSNAMNLQVMIKDAFDRGQLDFLKELIRSNFTSEIIQLLEKVLVESNQKEDEKILALQLIEELKEKAASLLKVVSPLLDSNIENIRYSAARATIAINSNQILASKALRSILNSQKFRELMLEPKINGIIPIVEALLQNSSANLGAIERRNLLRLLRTLLGPDAVIAEQIEASISESTQEKPVQ